MRSVPGRTHGCGADLHGSLRGPHCPCPCRGKTDSATTRCFYYPEMDKTFAQMTMEEKSRVSHRGTALAEMKSEFAKVLIWIRQQMPTFQPISFGGERP